MSLLENSLKAYDHFLESSRVIEYGNPSKTFFTDEFIAFFSISKIN